MYAILLIMMLCVFVNMAQVKNNKTIGLTYQYIYFNPLFLDLGKSVVRLYNRQECENVNRAIFRISTGTIDQSIKKDCSSLYIIDKIREDEVIILLPTLSIKWKAINIIFSALYKKNKREGKHSERVSRLCVCMGKALGLSEDKIEKLKVAGLLHDIGKIAIEESILNKEGKLTRDEWNRVKKHSQIGYKILNPIDNMCEVAEYVLAHHERWDGMGYPNSLKQQEIPFQSRIICIADSYDAMISERSYGSSLPVDLAVDELRENIYKQFDPDLTQVFIDKVIYKYFLFK